MFWTHFFLTFSSNFNEGEWLVEEEKSIFIHMDEFPGKSPPEAVNLELRDFLPAHCECKWNTANWSYGFCMEIFLLTQC